MKIRRHLLTSILAIAILLVASAAHAASGDMPCASYICLVADTGLVVAEQNADEERAPASMVKMMEMLLVAEGLAGGDWSKDKEIGITREIERISGAQAYLKTGETWSLAKLMDAVAVCSANDAAMAVANGLWGSGEAYLKRANERAKSLGMASTTLRSVHGLPPSGDGAGDLTTARDMSLLARECVKNPLVMAWVGQDELAFRKGTKAKPSTNRLLGRLRGCDGLKTGFTSAAGYCITATAKRDDIRLITVVMGCDSLSARFDVAERILEDGFKRVRRVRIVKKGQPLDEALPVDNCGKRTIRLAAADDVWCVMPKDQADEVVLMRECPERLAAPLESGALVGKVEAKLNGSSLGSAPLAVPQRLEVPGWSWKLRHSVLARYGEVEPRPEL
ncbi:MAG: D-alanyl-D-alanine carboxypeptidase [bacterium]|nr:D-alanyl-D-alanine carboxypeptidase [bacterium]